MTPRRPTFEPRLPGRRRALYLAAGCVACPWLLLPPAGAQADRDTDALSAVLAAEHRAASRTRDAARRPYETLRFFGVAAGHTVLELLPGGGWYTEILAPYLRPNGRLLAAHYAREATTGYQRTSRQRYDEKLAASPGLYDQVRVGTLPGLAGPADFDLLAPPGSVDRVLSFRNVHNWTQSGELDLVLRASFRALKPGGVIGFEEHRALPGTTPAEVAKSGYTPEAFVIERAMAAGFTQPQASEINANPRDTRDHAQGVWALPPTLRGGETDRARYLAIGESDRMTLRLSKPVR